MKHIIMALPVAEPPVQHAPEQQAQWLMSQKTMRAVELQAQAWPLAL